MFVRRQCKQTIQSQSSVKFSSKIDNCFISRICINLLIGQKPTLCHTCCDWHWGLEAPNNAAEIRSIFHHIDDFLFSRGWGFGGGPLPVSLACFRAALKLFLALCCKLPHLNFTWSTVRRWIPTAFIISVTSAYFAFFRELVIKLLCFAFKTSLFFSKNSVKILISDSEQLLLLSRLVAIVTVRRQGKRACRRL